MMRSLINSLLYGSKDPEPKSILMKLDLFDPDA